MILTKTFLNATLVLLLGARPFVLLAAANSDLNTEPRWFFRSGGGAPKRPPPYVEPLWYPRMEAADDTGLLKRCRRRTRKDAPPKTGNPCSRRPKTCYFGTQDCESVGAHPETKCVCEGRHWDGPGAQTWRCEPSSCPSRSERTRCPAEGEALLRPGNDLACPADASELPVWHSDCPFNGLSCAMGVINCCGTCSSESVCQCYEFGWECDSEFTAPAINCIGDGGPQLPPSCDGGDFSGLIGGTCVEARTRILDRYPGLTVICLSESDPKPTNLDFLRYIVETDDNSGVVKNINYTSPFFDSCPVRSSINDGALCQFDEECFYEPFVTISIEGGVNTTCTDSRYVCKCVAASDPNQERGVFRCEKDPGFCTTALLYE